MFDRIGEAWAAFGETEPHWSVLVDDAFRQQNLAANINVFYESGLADISMQLAFAERAGASLLKSTRALDFGCGVGRLTLALADRFASVVGVDISPGHLRLARERASVRLRLASAMCALSKFTPLTISHAGKVRLISS